MELHRRGEETRRVLVESLAVSLCRVEQRRKKIVGLVTTIQLDGIVIDF
jgi:hypothetical protein